MTAAPVEVRPGPFTLFPPGAATELGRAGRRFLEKYLWPKTRFGTLDGLVITDREIAAELGVSIRTAQEAVRQVCDLVIDGVARPIAERFFKYGPRSVCGRVIRIVAPELVPVEKREETPAPEAKRKPRAKAAPPSNPIPPPVFTPEDLAVAARRAAAVEAPPPEPTAEEVAAAERFWEESRRRNAARAAAAEAEEKRRSSRPKLTPDQLRAQIERVKAAREEEERIKREMAIAMGLEKREPGTPEAHRRE